MLSPCTHRLRLGCAKVHSAKALRTIQPRLQTHCKANGNRNIEVVAPDYRLGISVLTLAGVLGLVGGEPSAAVVPGILGAFLTLQTSRVRFVFDFSENTMEVLIGSTQSDSLTSSGENAFVGGENKWRLDTVVNWDFWWKPFPVLVYFKETQTSEKGQIHFFPCLMDGQRMYELLEQQTGQQRNILGRKE